MRLTPRRQYIIARINNGAVLVTDRDNVVLSTPRHIGNYPDEHIQIALFLKMIQDGIFYQQLHPPFYFELSDRYKSTT